jgi:hypothetical protein
MFEKNEVFLNCPTFIPQEGKAYGDEIIMNPSDDDPNE